MVEPRRIFLVGSPITRATAGASGTARVTFLKKLVLTIASASGRGSSIVGAPSVASSSLVRNTVLMPSRSHAWMLRTTSMNSLPPASHVTTAP